jgi:hypothetical protein
MLTAGQKKVTEIHSSTIKQLSQTERFFVDLFVKEGSYKIITDERVAT